MSSCLKTIRIFWMLALLLMAGGQVLHARAELAAAKDHAHCSHEATSDECPADTSCCHLHTSGATLLSSGNLVPTSQALSHNLPILDETCLEGPRGEIDYPPQLS